MASKGTVRSKLTAYPDVCNHLISLPDVLEVEQVTVACVTEVETELIYPMTNAFAYPSTVRVIMPLNFDMGKTVSLPAMLQRRFFRLPSRIP